MNNNEAKRPGQNVPAEPPVKPPKPSGKARPASKVRRRNWAFVLLAIMIVGGVVAFKVVLTRDVPQPDTSKLELIRPDVAPEDNAFTYFCAATNSLYFPTNRVIVTDYLAGKPVPEAKLEEILARNEEMFEKVRQGLTRQIYLMPEMKTLYDPAPGITELLQMGKIMKIKARRERLAGNLGQAAESATMLNAILLRQSCW